MFTHTHSIGLERVAGPACFEESPLLRIVSGFHTFLSKGVATVVTGCVNNTFQKGKAVVPSDSPYSPGCDTNSSAGLQYTLTHPAMT